MSCWMDVLKRMGMMADGGSKQGHLRRGCACDDVEV
jgi:hypothetical protein